MKKLLVLCFALTVSILAKAQYCSTSQATTTADEEILNVTFGSINNSTTCANSLFGTCGVGTGITNRYANFTGCPPSSVFAGGIYPFSVTIGSCGTFNYLSGCKIYIDFNQDGDFVDVGEEVYFSGSVGINCVPQTILTGNITIPLTAFPGLTRMRIVDMEGGQFSATSITPCNSYGFGETEDYTINIIPPVPCTGTPSAGTINAPDTITVCPTASAQLCSSGFSNASDLAFQWLKSFDGGATWITMPGDTFLCYTTPIGAPSALYQLTVICLNSFGLDTSSNNVYVNVVNPIYAQVPYTQDFETWMDYCDNKDVPDDFHWKNGFANGDKSWRRNDQGMTANWTFPSSGAYSPAASIGQHSARFHTYYAPGTGNLDLYLNLSSAPGVKELFFDYKQPTTSISLTVSFSNNGGATFTTLGTYNTLSNWDTKQLTLNSDSASCILRFTGNTGTYNADIGIDNIRVVPPCTGAPSAGVILDTTYCPGDSFKMFTVNGSQAAGLSYVWQSAPSNLGPWTTIGTTTTNNITYAINAPTYFRCIVTCVASGQSNTTPVQFTDINTFYYCYCNNGATSTFDPFDMGCVQLLKIDSPGFYTALINNVPIGVTDTFSNGNATNSYTNFQFGLPVKKIYVDSTYETRLTVITQNSWSPYASSKMYIDFNRNGIFDAADAVGGAQISSSTNSVVFQFTVPSLSYAQPGITGVRVITSDVGSAASITPCGVIFGGEVEDYLVEIALPDCKAPTDPGIAHITDTLLCDGYTTILYDTNHTLVSSYVGLSMQWQSSPNGTTWTNIAGANSDSLISVVNAQTSYRLKMICNGKDTVYSNSQTVKLIPSYACYPASASFGGNSDTADNGYFTIGQYSFSSGGATGPHIGNPAAIRARTDFSPLGASTLYADSTYLVSFYNILKPYNHSDARITMFIDYNHNNLYDIPAERIYTGISGPTSFYLPFSFKTAINPVMNTETGMRIILNNNVLPNNASDLGVGLYTSGETEDFLVKFIKKPVVPLKINDVMDLQNVSIYPNPSNGIVFLDLVAYSLPYLNISVTTITGAEVFNAKHANINGKFNTSLNLSELAKGTYLVKLQTERGTVIQKITLQ
jgi:GEVED domain/Secretion system C-terminal sorting domain